ncbi:hypothetical protein ACSBR1_033002 [Camellia fascicularis]
MVVVGLVPLISLETANRFSSIPILLFDAIPKVKNLVMIGVISKHCGQWCKQIHRFYRLFFYEAPSLQNKFRSHVGHRDTVGTYHVGHIRNTLGTRQLVSTPMFHCSARDYLFAPSLSGICQAVDFIHDISGVGVCFLWVSCL